MPIDDAFARAYAGIDLSGMQMTGTALPPSVSLKISERRFSVCVENNHGVHHIYHVLISSQCAPRDRVADNDFIVRVLWNLHDTIVFLTFDGKKERERERLVRRLTILTQRVHKLRI